jgi:predicted PurR-regulated permease PerM
MFIALVTGVYTFGLVGVIIGPVLIAVLKAVFETVTGGNKPGLLDRLYASDHAAD